MKYKSKPVVIEAIQYLGDENKFEVVEFFKGGGEFVATFCDFGITIDTRRHGKVKCLYTDWIIKGTEGEFYPCKDSVFKTKYELVEE